MDPDTPAEAGRKRLDDEAARLGSAARAARAGAAAAAPALVGVDLVALESATPALARAIRDRGARLDGR